MLEYWQPTCFSWVFSRRLMLAYVAGSVSTDLNVWERMASPCVSQAAYHSATTASVVWLLALDFIFTRCVSPCPQNFNIGCCANEKPLRLIAHRRVRFFTFIFVSTLVLGARGGAYWIQFKLRKVLWFWRLTSVPPQCQHNMKKTAYDLWFYGVMTHEESHVLRWLKNGTYARHTRRLCEHL